MVTILAVKRRTLVERRILPLLRGEEDDVVSGILNSRMRELKARALKAGLTILPAGSTYVGRDELVLLGWLASTQRGAPLVQTVPDDAALAATIRRCADALEAAGLHLSSLALYGSRDPRR